MHRSLVGWVAFTLLRFTGATSPAAGEPAASAVASPADAARQLDLSQLPLLDGADAATVPDSPIATRELIRRRVIRLRTQHAHVRTARVRAHHQRLALHRLRYRLHRGAGHDSRAASAVRAALGKLGRPYVWGATGPDRVDCSGLVQWAYAQAGVRLHRTTYEQIHDGVAVARADVRPGDLVFPHTGHVQLAIGNGLVVEAPQPGATVQISRMGHTVAIRRPA
jgi:cell wall-associated NlpC family hydrolase